MLTSLKNPLVKQIRKLHQAKERRSQRQFLFEGTHLLEEAMAVDYPLQVVCCTPQWQARHDRLWQELCLQAERVELVSPEVLQSMATTVQPDGVIATATYRPSPQPPASQLSLGVVLETIQDPGNLGAIIRTAVAAEVDGLWLSDDSVNPDHPKVLRASAGQWFRLPMAATSDLPNQIQTCRQAGLQILATCATVNQSYWDVDLRQPTMVLLGNEGAGLSSELIDLADLKVKIPVSPGVESLNVAIVAALIFYEAQRQRQFNP